MKWFRLYHDVMHDPKVQRMRPELFKFWINILCLASASKVRGTLPDVEEIAYILRLKTPVVRRYLEELEGLVLLHRGVSDPSRKEHARSTEGWVVHNWSDRQPESDDVAERVRRHRKKTSVKPPLQPDRECNVTGNVSGNVTATVQIQKEIKSKKECLVETEASRAIQTSETRALLSSPQRSEADLADIRRAEALLEANLQTHHLALELGRNHGINGMQAIPGWKFLYAAQRVTSGDYGQDKLRWPYFLGIARSATEAERDTPIKPAAKQKPPEPTPPYLREDFGPAWFYRRRGLPLPVGHPEYGKEPPGLPSEASPGASGIDGTS